MRSRALTNVTSYSICIAEAALRRPQRGVVHSVFSAAANIVFPGNFVLSLNAAVTPRMPNGLQLSSSAGSFPFSALRPGMPVIFGAQRLHIEAIDCSLDLSQSPQWNPHIQRPNWLDMTTLQKNYVRLKALAEEWDLSLKGEGYSASRGGGCGGWEAGGTLSGGQVIAAPPRVGVSSHDRGHPSLLREVQALPPHYNPTPAPTEDESALTDIHTLARYLCGRGIGLTPSGDDILAGWMAAGWLLYGPEPGFLNACQQIVEIARQQTHILSSCWLAHAAEGNVAESVAELLHAMTRTDDSRLEISIKAVLSMGASSGYDLIQGILLTANIGYNR